jgi:hypothetical protein
MPFYKFNNFEKQLGKFSDKIEIIVGLEMGGKISPEEAYQQIKEMYKELKKLRKKEKDTWETENE